MVAVVEGVRPGNFRPTCGPPSACGLVRHAAWCMVYGGVWCGYRDTCACERVLSVRTAVSRALVRVGEEWSGPARGGRLDEGYAATADASRRPQPAVPAPLVFAAHALLPYTITPPAVDALQSQYPRPPGPGPLHLHPQGVPRVVPPPPASPASPVALHPRGCMPLPSACQSTILTEEQGPAFLQ